MTHTTAIADPASSAIQLGQAWMAAYREDPEFPERAEHYQQVEQWLNLHLENNTPSIDELVGQAFRWMTAQDQQEAAIAFMHVLLPHFESISPIGEGEDRVAYLVALPIIGHKEHAAAIAADAARFKFEDDMASNGIIPPGATIAWLPRPVSIHEAGLWMADARRSLMVTALEGRNMQQALSQQDTVFGVDRAELSMLVGVVISSEHASDALLQSPTFLHASPDDFVDPDSIDGEPSEWAMDQRVSAFENASAQMTQKVVERGMEATVVEDPGTLMEALGTLVSWSLRAQQLEESQVLGISEKDLLEMEKDTTAEVAMDAPSNLASIMLCMPGHTMGPFQTDLPWRSLPLLMMAECLLKRHMVADPESIHWHPDQDKMWAAVRGSARKWRMH